jgi:hypothetical protein
LTRVDLACVGALVLAVLAALFIEVPGPRRLVIDVGPNDGPYVSGFHGSYEIEKDGRLATRWSLREAAIRWPFVVDDGPVTFVYRFARVLPESATVDVRLGGQTIDRFSCRGGQVLERRTTVAALDEAPLAISFGVASQDRQGLGLQFDWARVEAGPGARLRPVGAARLAPLLLLPLAWLLHWRGAPWRYAALGCAAAAAAYATALVLHPMTTAHLAGHLALPGLALAVLAACLLPRGGVGATLLAVSVAAFVLKGAWLFHPAAFYPDVQQHRRYLFALREAPGGLRERMAGAQARLHWGERTVAGRTYAFPYSPVFYLPFFGLRDDHQATEDAMRQAGLVAAALEPVAAYAIGAAALGAGTGLAAGVLVAALPVAHSRLLLAMWPTLVGHALDLLVILSALRYLREPTGRRLALLAAATLGAFLTYITSLFTVSAFLLCLALLARPRARALVGLWLGGALACVLLLYAPFVRSFVTEILPSMLQAAPASAPEPAAPEATGLLAAARRLPLFFGWSTLAVAAGGALLARRRLSPEGRPVLAAWALAFFVLLGLRAFGGGLFRDLKEISFVSTLVAIAAAAVVAHLGEKHGRWPAGLALAALVTLGLGRAAEFRAGYASGVTASAFVAR